MPLPLISVLRSAAARCVALIGLALLVAACGGTGTPASSLSSNGNVTVTLQVTGQGSITADSTVCTGTCKLSLAKGSTVSLTANASATEGFLGWMGGCAGLGNPCVATAAESITIGAVFGVAAATVGAPEVLYTDALSGPTGGGEGGQGAYLSIFGLNLGDASGLGTRTRVYIGGAEVANYRYLGVSRVSSKLGVQQLTVQVGALGGATQGRALPIRVTVDGVDSNTDHTFTPNPGRVLFVSLDGDDATARADDIARPWRHLQNGGEFTGVMATVQAGDHVVIRGGAWSDATGVDDTWLRFMTRKGSLPTGTAGTGWIHLTAYPGPVLGNAIETVHYTTPGTARGGIQGPSSVHAGDGGEYISVSNLELEVGARAATDGAPINLQYTVGHWRIVNNRLGPWPSSWKVATDGINAKAGGVAGHGNDVKVLGNHILGIDGDRTVLENHGIYADTTAANWEVGWNWVHDVPGGTLVQFYDNEGGAGTYVLPDGSVWQGFNGIRIHHNWLENGAKYGLNVADPGTNGGGADVRAWNNLIIGVNAIPVRIALSTPTYDIVIAHNTLFDNAMNVDRGWFRNESKGNLPRSMRAIGNVLALGPRSVTQNAWFDDMTGESTGWVFQQNLYWDNGHGRGGLARDASAVVGDPRIVYTSDLRLSLLPDSVAIDRASLALPFAITDDLYGRVTRPLGAGRDLGAIEVR